MRLDMNDPEYAAIIRAKVDALGEPTDGQVAYVVDFMRRQKQDAADTEDTE